MLTSSSETWKLRLFSKTLLASHREPLEGKSPYSIYLNYTCCCLQATSDSSQPHIQQHTRLPCPLPSPMNLLKFMFTESVMPSSYLSDGRPPARPPAPQTSLAHPLTAPLLASADPEAWSALCTRPQARQGCSRPGGPALNPKKAWPSRHAGATCRRRGHRHGPGHWGAAAHSPGIISTPSPHAECKVQSKGPGIAEPIEQNAALNPAIGIPDPQRANTRGRKERRASHQAPTWKHIWYWTSLPSTFAWTFHNPSHRPVMTYMQSFVYSLTHVLFITHLLTSFLLSPLIAFSTETKHGKPSPTS